MFTDDLELEALRLAYDLIRNDGIVCDMRLFTVIAEKIQGRLGEGYLLDEKWRLTKNNNFVKQDSILRNDLESATVRKSDYKTLLAQQDSILYI